MGCEKERQRPRSVFLLADIEGITGVCEKRQCKPFTRQWAKARDLITAEVGNVVEGLKEAGVQEVFVRDLHGTGYNLIAEKVAGRGVHCVQGQFWKPVPLVGKIPASDCAVMIGWHAAPDQTEGFSPHIFHRSIRSLKINGKPVTEVELFAAVLGEYGIPVTFLTADATAISRICRNMPWVSAVAIPKRPLLREEICAVRRRVRDGVIRSVKGGGPANPLVLGTHGVELALEGRTWIWESDSACHTLIRILARSIFRGYPLFAMPLLLFLYRFWSRARMRMPR